MGKRKFDSSKGEEKFKIPKNEKNTEEIVVMDTEEPQKVPTEDVACGFNIKHFRKELNAKQGQTIALTQFLQVCTNPDMKKDYMLEYLKSGGNSHEILKQISSENKKNLTLATPTFHLFHLIILKVQASLPHMITITEEACRYFLNTFMPTVEIMISEHSGPRHRKIVLKLFTSMVTLNADLGVEILNQAPLTPKHLQYIVEKANYKEKDNVRTSFVQFITSFLVEGHLPLIKALLEKQGLLSLVIPGLIQDESEAVIMFLNILKTNVVENHNISKSLKLKTFSHLVLHNMFKLYYWRGPSEIEHNTKKEMQLVITSLLSEVILTLFTSHKQGLYFIDKTLGTTDTHKNQNLYKALLSLKRPWENTEQCEVILQIVDECPDLHRALITVIEQSFDPQNTLVWYKTANFIKRLLEKIKPQDVLERLNQLNPIQITNFIRFTTLPIPLLKFLKQGITNRDMFITTVCVEVLVKMMATLKKYLDLLETNNSLVVDLLKNRLEGFIPKHLTTPDSLVSIIKYVMSEQKPQKSNNEMPDISTSITLISLIDLLLLYHEIQPSSLEGIEGNLDMKNILTYVGHLPDNVLLLKFKIVSLWLSLDPNAISLHKTIFTDLLLIMLDVYTNNDDVISLQSKTTLRNFLKSTSIFEGGEDEIDLILHTLRNAKVENMSLIIEIIQKTISNSDVLKNTINSCIKNSEMDQENDSDGTQKLLDYLSSDNIQNIDHKIFIHERTPSPFILGCLLVAKENKSNREILKNFISLFSLNLMYYYASPEIMLTILEPYKTEIKAYISSWLETPITLSKEFTQSDEIMNKIATYIINEETNFDEIFPHFEVVSEENTDLRIRSLNIKWNSPITMDTSELLLWSNLVTFNLLQLTKLNILNEYHLEKILQCLDAIQAIAKESKAIDISRKILYNIFKNSITLQYFSPICKQNNSTITLLTKFLINVVEKYGAQLLHLHSQTKLMKPYQHKIFVEVRKMMKKVSKKKVHCDEDIMIKILEIIGMNKTETIEIVKLILNIDPKNIVTENKEPSIVIKILGCILTDASSSGDYLPPDVVAKVFNLYTKVLKDPEINITMIHFENVMKGYFEKQPQHVRLISKDSFKNFFSSKVLRKSTSQLAATLLQRNYQLCEVFKQEIQNPEVIGQRELALPLGEAIINHTQFIDQNLQLLNKIYIEYKSSIQKALEKPHKVGQIYSSHWKFVRKLIYECMDVEDCAKFFEKVHKFEAVEIFHIQLIQAVFIKICISNQFQKKIYIINYYTMMLNLLTVALKADAEYEILKEITMNIDTVARISKEIKTFETENKEQFKLFTNNAVWQNFCKAAIKDSLKIKTVDEKVNVIGPRLLNILSTLIKVFYDYDDEDIATLFDMVTSHSEFLNVMLSHHSRDIKSRLIELLYTLIMRNKSVMKAQQIPVYLSAYHATRNPSDRLLLNILHFYETTGQTIHEYRPYIWGDSGAHHYAVKKNRSSSLWGHPTPNQILNLLDKEVMEKTIKNFPVNQRLDYQYELPLFDETENWISNSVAVLIERMKSDMIFTLNKKKDVSSSVNRFILRSKYNLSISQIRESELTSGSHIVDEESQNIYDPAFILPIMSQLLAPGSVVSCFKIVRNGLLGLPLVALSSHCPMMRAAGYHVLHRFCQQLETESKHRNDKLFITDFMDTLRQSLPTAIISAQKENDTLKDEKNPQLSSIAALYLARSVNVATAPFDPLYKPVNNFLIAKQQIDLTVIPDFLSLFHDSDVESTERRLWILKAISDGTKSLSDMNVIFKTMALKMVMDFYLTVIADKKTKDAILELLSNAISIPRAAEILIESYGLMSWLNGVVKDFKLDQKSLVVTMINLLNNLCRSLSVSAFSKMLGNLNRHGKYKDNNTGRDINDFGDLKINKEIEQQILYLHLDILPFLNLLSRGEQVIYFSVLISLSKNTLKLMNNNHLNLLVKNSTEGLENNYSIQLLKKAIFINDGKILNIENLTVDPDDAEEYAAKMYVVKTLGTIVMTFL